MMISRGQAAVRVGGFATPTFAPMLQSLERRVMLAAAVPLTGAEATSPLFHPSQFVVAGNVAYFTHHHPDHGSEIWRTDGTAAGTRIFADVVPGSAGSSPFNLVPVGKDRVVFTTSSGASNTLWVTNGTRSGTFKLREVSTIGEMIGVGNVAYFTGPIGGGQFGGAIYKTDGTRTGTVQVTTLPPGQGGLFPKSLFAYGNKLLFNNEQTGRNGVWRSDGTAAGTVQLLPGTDRSLATAFRGWVAYKKAAFFATPEALWRTDGTPAGTRVVKQVGNASSLWAGAADGRLHFFADAGGGRRSLWRSDGTARGTVALTNVGPDNADVGNLTGSGKWLFFTTQARSSQQFPTGPISLWRTDGTAAGTTLVERTENGFLRSQTHSFGDSLITQMHGQLRQTDGTAAGTFPIRAAGAGSARLENVTRIMPFNGSLLVLARARDGASGNQQLWRYTPSGSASGVVFADADADGRIDAGEKRLGGFRVFADANRNGRFDPNEIWSRTNARGEYLLLGLDEGQHAVGVTAVDGWSASQRPFKSVLVRPGADSRVHFGQKRIG